MPRGGKRNLGRHVFLKFPILGNIHSNVYNIASSHICLSHPLTRHLRKFLGFHPACLATRRIRLGNLQDHRQPPRLKKLSPMLRNFLRAITQSDTRGRLAAARRWLYFVLYLEDFLLLACSVQQFLTCFSFWTRFVVLTLLVVFWCLLVGVSGV